MTDIARLTVSDLMKRAYEVEHACWTVHHNAAHEGPWPTCQDGACPAIRSEAKRLRDALAERHRITLLAGKALAARSREPVDG